MANEKSPKSNEVSDQMESPNTVTPSAPEQTGFHDNATTINNSQPNFANPYARSAAVASPNDPYAQYPHYGSPSNARPGRGLLPLWLTLGAVAIAGFSFVGGVVTAKILDHTGPGGRCVGNACKEIPFTYELPIDGGYLDPGVADKYFGQGRAKVEPGFILPTPAPTPTQ